MTLWEGLVAMGVVLSLGFLIFIKMSKQNPAAANRLKDWTPKAIYDNVKVKIMPEKTSHIYEERRTLL